jgi:flagellar biogenesis protein FliO
MKTSRSRRSIPTTDHALPFSDLANEASLSSLRNPTGLLSRAWEWIRTRRMTRTSDRRLRVAETVSLGEKRFVAVVQVDGRHFLLAGGPTNIALLAQLDTKQDFEDVLKKTMTVPAKQSLKRARKQNALQEQPANAPSTAQLNGTKAFGDVLKKTMTTPNKYPAKQIKKQNARSTIKPMGEYA